MLVIDHKIIISMITRYGCASILKYVFNEMNTWRIQKNQLIRQENMRVRARESLSSEKKRSMSPKKSIYSLPRS